MMAAGRLGQNQESIQATNRSLVLELIHKEKVCSRAYLAKNSGLQPATVTYIVNDLMRLGVIEESGFIQGEKGRRSIGVSISPKNFCVLAIRLTRVGYLLALFNLRGELIEERSFSNSDKSRPNESIADVIANAVGLVDDNQSYKPLSICIAVPGPFNAVEEEIVLMTGAEVWNMKAMRYDLEKAFDLPVMMIHDANAGALCQYWMNDQRLSKGTAVYVSVGQGVGCGVLVNGEVLEGNLGFAGEIGHMSINFDGYECACGNRGCLERYTSSTALVAIINEKYATDLTFRQIADEIGKGNGAFMSEYRNCCRYLGQGAVNIINCFNPAVIVFGDEMTRIAPDLLLSIVKDEVDRRTLPQIHSTTTLSVDKNRRSAELYGAGVVAIRYVFDHIADML